MDFLNELQYRFGTQGANEGKVVQGSDGQYDPGLLGRMVGVTPEMMEAGAQSYQRREFAKSDLGQEAANYDLMPKSGAVNRPSIRKAIAKQKNIETLNEQAAILGIDTKGSSDVGILRGLVEDGRVDKTNKNLINSPQWQQQESRYNDTKAQQLDAFKLARADIDYNREEAAARRSFDKRESALDRRQSQDLAILTNDHQMQLAQMNEGLAGKRMEYDRETRRMDKRDRLIAQLMSGIGSLGGAFSM